MKIVEVTDFLRAQYNFAPYFFIDIGANIGTHLIFAIRSNIYSQAIGVEANKDNFNILQANVLINELDSKVDLYCVALSNKADIMEMELSNSNYGDHRIKASENTTVTFGEESERTIIGVQSTTVDLLFKDFNKELSSALIWVDTQGHEGHIFDGAYTTFITGDKKPFVVSEFWPYGLERSGGKKSYFKFLSNCKKIYDINQVDWQNSDGVSVEELSLIYEQMLAHTKKEFHPHTDLLLIL